MRHYLFFLSTLFYFSLSAQAQLSASLQNKLQDTLSAMRDQYNFKGLSAAVAYKDFGIWEGTAGVSGPQTTLTSDMLIGIGSNTKTFVSVLMLKLYESNSIQLEDSIGTWLSGYPNINGAVTIRQLLNHTSGIADYLESDNLLNVINADLHRFWMREELLEYVGTPYFSPGSSFAYSNTNYLIAGYIQEQVTGRPLQALLRDSIIQPLGLQHTFYPPFETADGTYATFWTDITGDGSLDPAFDWNDAASPISVNLNSIARDAGALVSTPKDVVTFWQQLLNGNLLSAEVLQEQMLQGTGFGTQNSEYGLGIFLERYKDIPMFSHGGTWIGQINSNLNDTLNDIYIDVLSNQDSLSNAYVDLVVKALYQVVEDFNATSVAAWSTDAGLHCYPNPVRDRLFIEVPVTGQMKAIEVWDINGHVVLRQQPASDTKYSLHVAELPAGVYLVKVRVPEAWWATQFIKL